MHLVTPRNRGIPRAAPSTPSFSTFNRGKKGEGKRAISLVTFFSNCKNKVSREMKKKREREIERVESNNAPFGAYSANDIWTFSIFGKISKWQHSRVCLRVKTVGTSNHLDLPLCPLAPFIFKVPPPLSAVNLATSVHATGSSREYFARTRVCELTLFDDGAQSSQCRPLNKRKNRGRGRRRRRRNPFFVILILIGI